MIDLSRVVERMPSMEQALGVQFAGIHASLDENGFLSVRGEMTARTGDRIPQSVNICAAAYNASSQIVATSSHYVSEDEFIGFDVFDMLMAEVPTDITRIRVFPKK